LNFAALEIIKALMDCLFRNSFLCEHQNGPDCGACAALQASFQNGERRQWLCLSDVPEDLRAAHQAPEQEEMQRDDVTDAASARAEGRGGARAGAGRRSNLDKAAESMRGQPKLLLKRARIEEHPAHEEEPVDNGPVDNDEYCSMADRDDAHVSGVLAESLTQQLKVTVSALEATLQGFVASLRAEYADDLDEVKSAIAAARDDAGRKIAEMQRLRKAHTQLDVLGNECTAVLASGKVRLGFHSVGYINLRSSA
jgi:hypothetical protein